MSELQLLITAYDELLRSGAACALATVVEVNGSAYRRPGARMLVAEDGRLTGTISGGCLEGDARRRAQQVMHRGKPEIMVYDSMDIEEDLEHGAQLGCQGEVHILLEPINTTDANNPLELLRSLLKLPAPAVLATVLRSETSAVSVAGRLLVQGDVELMGSLKEEDFANLLQTDVRGVLENGESVNADYQYQKAAVNVFIELIKPAPVVSIYGAGNDARPLAELAVRLGWRVNVLDGRPLQASLQRFLGAEAVMVAPVDDLSEYIIPTGFAVLMSHNYHYDLAVLRQLCNQPAVQYIGILGPRKKTDRMLNDLQQDGVDLTGLTERLHSPVGLDIGGENAEEIALSIMAELLAVRNRLQGGFLRNLNAPIHGRNKVNSTTI